MRIPEELPFYAIILSELIQYLQNLNGVQTLQENLYLKE